jgi:hypothetical protein
VIAIGTVAVVGLLAKAVVEYMSTNDGRHARQYQQKRGIPKTYKLMHHKQGNTQCKNNQRGKPVVVPAIPVPQRGYANYKSRTQQQQFHPYVVHQVDAKQRQTAQQQGRKRTMYGTYKRCANTQRVPVYPKVHSATAKVPKNATKLQKLKRYHQLQYRGRTFAITIILCGENF